MKILVVMMRNRIWRFLMNTSSLSAQSPTVIVCPRKLMKKLPTKTFSDNLSSLQTWLQTTPTSKRNAKRKSPHWYLWNLGQVPPLCLPGQTPQTHQSSHSPSPMTLPFSPLFCRGKLLQFADQSLPWSHPTLTRGEMLSTSILGAPVRPWPWLWGEPIWNICKWHF